MVSRHRQCIVRHLTPFAGSRPSQPRSQGPLNPLPPPVSANPIPEGSARNPSSPSSSPSSSAISASISASPSSLDFSPAALSTAALCTCLNQPVRVADDGVAEAIEDSEKGIMEEIQKEIDRDRQLEEEEEMDLMAKEKAVTEAMEINQSAQPLKEIADRYIEELGQNKDFGELLWVHKLLIFTTFFF